MPGAAPSRKSTAVNPDSASNSLRTLLRRAAGTLPGRATPTGPHHFESTSSENRPSRPKAADRKASATISLDERMLIPRYELHPRRPRQINPSPAIPAKLLICLRKRILHCSIEASRGKILCISVTDVLYVWTTTLGADLSIIRKFNPHCCAKCRFRKAPCETRLFCLIKKAPGGNSRR